MLALACALCFWSAPAEAPSHALLQPLALAGDPDWGLPPAGSRESPGRSFGPSDLDPIGCVFSAALGTTLGLLAVAIWYVYFSGQFMHGLIWAERAGPVASALPVRPPGLRG